MKMKIAILNGNPAASTFDEYFHYNKMR